MYIKSFLLKKDNLAQIAAQCGADTVAIIRPEKQIEALLREAIRLTIREKKSAREEFNAIGAYFEALCDIPSYQEYADKMVDSLSSYLRESMYIQLPDTLIIHLLMLYYSIVRIVYQELMV